MASLKHQQQTYECRHCHELYLAHPVTNHMCLQGQCWACLFVINLSASSMDRALAFVEQEMVYEGYDIPLEGDC